MSRATRPLRRVRGAEREQLVVVVTWGLGWAPRERVRVGALSKSGPTGWRLRRLAREMDCRPSHLRRCLLGRQVSARAAGRILHAAGRPRNRPGHR